MAVSAASGLNVAGSDVDGTSYATASWSPTTGKLYIVGLYVYDLEGAASATASISGNNITWTSVNTVSGHVNGYVSVWAGYADGSQTTGAITFSNVVTSGTANAAVWGVAELTGASLAGSPPGIVQSATAVAAADSVSATLGAFASTSNATGAWVTSFEGSGTTPPAITAGTGFALVSGLDAGQSGDASFALRLAFEFRNDNDTGVDATAAVANDRMHIIAFEIAAATAASRRNDRLTAAINRNAYW